MTETAFTKTLPEQLRSCVVFASPHSGRDYPISMMQQTVLNDHSIRSSEDAFVDRLFDCAPEFGASFIKANVPRAFVDFNRSAEELDPALIEGVRRQGHNPRVASGLGVIPRVVANGRSIYRGKITWATAQRRIDDFWRPYHAALRDTLDAAHLVHGQSVLIDCHSMPHEAVDGLARTGAPRPDVVLGDRFGVAASGEVMDRVEAAFSAEGFAVARNAPFAGAYITQAYGRPAQARHAVQVEIDRALYMDERNIRPHSGFRDVRARLRRVVAGIAEVGSNRLPLAAE